MRAYLRLIYWEWIRETRKLDTFVSMVVFALITLMIFSFAIDPESMTATKVRAGILWITFLTTGAIGIDRAFRGEGATRVLQGLLLSPVSRVTIYYGKLTSTFLLVTAMELVTLVLFCLLYNVESDGLPRVLLVMVMGTLGYVAAGVTLSAMTRTVQGGDVLLRVLLFPLMIPVFSVAVDATKLAFAGGELTMRHLGILAVFDVVFIMAGQILFDQIMADYDVN